MFFFLLYYMSSFYKLCFVNLVLNAHDDDDDDAVIGHVPHDILLLWMPYAPKINYKRSRLKEGKCQAQRQQA